MTQCEECGKEFKNSTGLSAHIRFKHHVLDTPEAEVQAVVNTPPVGKPALIEEWNNEIAPIKVTVIGREATMLRPQCKVCQRGRHTRPRWWETCPHNPYVSVVPVESTVPKYEDTDEKGKKLPAGRQRLVGTQTFVQWVERPNRVQVSVNRRIGSGMAVERARRTKGFIFPEELRTPMYPDGVANTCEFRDCFHQEELRDYRWGRFCRPIEARLVGHDVRMNGGGGALEVGSEPQNIEKQRMQLESVPI